MGTRNWGQIERLILSKLEDKVFISKPLSVSLRTLRSNNWTLGNCFMFVSVSCKQKTTFLMFPVIIISLVILHSFKKLNKLPPPPKKTLKNINEKSEVGLGHDLELFIRGCLFCAQFIPNMAVKNLSPAIGWHLGTMLPLVDIWSLWFFTQTYAITLLGGTSCILLARKCCYASRRTSWLNRIHQ